MKKFTKLFLSCAIVSALVASTAVMASAADLVTKTNGLAGTYAESGDNAGKLTLDLSKLDGGIDTTQQATLLVVKGTAYTDDASVVGIDQAEGAGFTMTGLKGAPTEETADEDGYTVMVGYYTAGESSKFQIASATLFGSSVETTPVLIGDVDFGGTIIAMDATMIARSATGSTANKGQVGTTYKVSDENFADVNQMIVGDVDLGGTVIAMDATMIARYATGSTANKGHVGETIKIVADAE